MTKTNGKVFVIGIDGATFGIIDPLIKKGKLPNISRLMDNGCSSRLISTIPSLSPVAWTSITTGASPKTHGIIDFLVYNKETKKAQFYDSTMRGIKPIWSVLSENEKQVCVLNVPMTFPVDKVNGFMISGLGTPPTNENFAYPEELYHEMLKEIKDYKIDINVREGQFDYQSILNSMQEVMDFRLKAMKFLLKKKEWDFFMLVFTITDRAQHFFWKFSDPEHPLYNVEMSKKFGSVINDIYERIDAAIGEIVGKLSSNDTILLVSDHGFGPLMKKFSLSRWMLDNGYIAPSKGKGLPASRKLINAVKRMVPVDMVHYLVKTVLKSRRQHKALLSPVEENLNMEETRAFSHKRVGSEFIYFNSDLVKSEKERKKLFREMTSGLMKVKDPVSLRPIFKAIIDGRDQYGTSPVMPDMVLIPEDGYEVSFELEKIRQIPLFDENKVWSGMHRKDGIFAISGPNIRKGVRLGDISVIDVVPTIYYLQCMAVPEGIDGKVVRECFINEFLIANKENKSQESIKTEQSDEGAYSEKETEEVSRRLADLGYM